MPPRGRTVVAVGFGQLLAWGSSYYLLAILARPMASALGLNPVVVYAEFSAALLLAAALGPAVGGLIDRHGGRRVLLASNVVFAAGLGTLAAAQGAVSLALGWLLIGAAMPMGLYDAAFSTLVGLYRAEARRSIVGVTLIAGFASSVSWPLTAALNAHFGWRTACFAWALLHLAVGASIHRFLLPAGRPAAPLHAAPPADAPAPPGNATLWLLAGVFTCNGFVFAAMAAHLPRVLQAAGCTPVAAVAAASLLGVSQVAARLADGALLSRLHPLVSARLSMAMHPLGAALLGSLGAPLATLFTALHGAGVGLMTIVKGTLPLALFGAAGFGRRSGLLEAPSRVAQALAPIAFGAALDHLGARALWISGGIAAAGWIGVLLLRADATRSAGAA
ncbi:MAG: MFS transporter [Nevskiaceae bacterium]|nr:MAG: MFS transporter [Nevskiaceae bacterium]